MYAINSIHADFSLFLPVHVVWKVHKHTGGTLKTRNLVLCFSIFSLNLVNSSRSLPRTMSDRQSRGRIAEKRQFPEAADPPPLQQVEQKKRKSAAQATRDWKERIKQNNSEEYVQYQAERRQSCQAHRRNSSEEMKARQREQSRLQMQAMRARKKEQQVEKPRLTRTSQEEQRAKWRRKKEDSTRT